MKLSTRTIFQRLVTYPLLLPIVPLYYITTNKKSVLDAFYLIRGLPHGYLKSKNRFAFYDSSRIVFPFDEDPSFDDVWLRNVYYPYVPQPNHMVVDVGAHMGFFTLKVAKYVSRVIAVEPDPTNFRYLLYNIHLNGLEDRVILNNFALGEKNGQIFLDRSGYGFGRSKITTEKTDCLSQIRTVDRLIEETELERVDLVKIDTEGSEFEVLKGARQTLHKYKPNLLVAAYHSHNERLGIADYLRKQGYDVYYYYVPFFLYGREIYFFARFKR